MDNFIYIIDKIYCQGRKKFLQRVFNSSFELIPEAEKGSLYELKGEYFVPTLCKGYDYDTLKKISFNKDDIFLGYESSKKNEIEAYEVYVKKRDEDKFSKEVIDSLNKLGTYSEFTSLYAPIQVEGENIGMIFLEKFNGKGFNGISKKIIKYYAQIISLFYTTKTFRKMDRRLYNQLITALVSAIEIKDKYTEGHGKRVKEYSIRIAKKMDLSKKQLDNISIAALLHDIGKIGISTEILNKVGPLTDEEYEIIKQHPVFSKRILEKIDGLSEVMELTFLHHERYDGKGYPNGLRGEEIPIEAQIIHLADAYDAMTSNRAYRKAMSREEAIGIIRKEIGKQFHPELASIAIEKVFTEKNRLDLHDKYSEKIIS